MGVGDSNSDPYTFTTHTHTLLPEPFSKPNILNLLMLLYMTLSSTVFTVEYYIIEFCVFDLILFKVFCFVLGCTHSYP